MVGWIQTRNKTGNNSTAQSRYASLTPASLIRVVMARGGQLGGVGVGGQTKACSVQTQRAWSGGSFKPWKGEGGKERAAVGVRAHLHVSLRLLMCAFSLTGGYQGEHASQPHTYMNTIITHSLGKYVRNPRLTVFKYTDTWTHTHRTKSKANNVSKKKKKKKA